MGFSGAPVIDNSCEEYYPKGGGGRGLSGGEGVCFWERVGGGGFVFFKLLKMDKISECSHTIAMATISSSFPFFFLFFFFFFCIEFRLSARISDFENILLMVHVGGVHACAAGARCATFFFTNARF